jgi:hypothetical protein
VAVYVEVPDPGFKLKVSVPVLAVRVIVRGVALVSVVLEPDTPVPAITVHVPPETEMVVVGLDPAVPVLVNVTEVLVVIAE